MSVAAAVLSAKKAVQLHCRFLPVLFGQCTALGSCRAAVITKLPYSLRTGSVVFFSLSAALMQGQVLKPDWIAMCLQG